MHTTGCLEKKPQLIPPVALGLVLGCWRHYMNYVDCELCWCLDSKQDAEKHRTEIWRTMVAWLMATLPRLSVKAWWLLTPVHTDHVRRTRSKSG